jgi:PST family polysaccharide transporter
MDVASTGRGDDELRGKTVRGAAWMALERWVDQAVALGVFIALGRMLSPRDFGLIAAANVVILFLRVVVDQGFSQSLVQRDRLEPGMVDTAFWTALGTGTGFALLTIVAAPLVGLVYGAPELTNVVRVLAIVFVLVGLDSTQSALLDRQMRFRVQALRRLVATAVSAAVAITIATLGGGVWALVGQAVSIELVTVVALWSVASWRPSLRFDRSSFRELAAWGSRYSVIRVLWFLSQNADNFLIGVVLGPVALGFYSIAYRVLVVFNELVALTVNQVVFSAFAKLQNNRPALNNAFYETSLATGALALPVYITLAVAARPAVIVVFGAKWAHSVPVMQVLAIAGAAQCQLLFSHNYAIVIGRLRSELRWTAGIVAAQVIGFAIAVQFGIVAVAASLAILTVAAWPLRLLMLRAWGNVSLKRYFAHYPALVVAGGAMCAASLGIAAALRGGSWLGLLCAEGVVGLAAYALALRLVSPSLVRRFTTLASSVRT